MNHQYDSVFKGKKYFFKLVTSNVNALSISFDSQYAAVGASKDDFKVVILDLWRKKIVHELDSLHHCKTFFDLR